MSEWLVKQNWRNRPEVLVLPSGDFWAEDWEEGRESEELIE